MKTAVEIAARENATRDRLAQDGPYEVRHGDVWTRHGGIHVADGSGQLAIAFDGSGVILKHGEAGKVSEYAARFDRKMADAMGDDAPSITVISFPVTAETVAELNACVACTGRVLDLERRLGTLSVTDGPGRYGP